ncbi:MAG: hypothetical protein IIC99_10985, partial [Chloroflexi bacterium]|nr:hypothetical protein [Chloroflexota bacterium]
MRVRRAAHSAISSSPGSNPAQGFTQGFDAWTRLKPAVRRAVFAMMAASIAALGWATFVFAAPVFQSAPNITVTPSEFYTGDSIEIALRGLPAGRLIHGGSVTLGGIRLSVPGVFGATGIQPITDASGEVSFTTKIPLEAPYGSHELVVNNLSVGGDRTTTVKVLAAEISFSPTSASPNETVILRGLGFSPSTSPGGNGPLGVHQITGEGKSGIMINGKLLKSPYVRYPIDLDSDGVLTVAIILPETYVTTPGIGLILKVVDDAERSGWGAWMIKQRKITVDPPESGRGGELTITGSGFAGTSRYNMLCTTVDISYGARLIKQVSPGATGSFTTVIQSPTNVALLSTNTIKATTPGCPMVAAATVTHKIPARTLNVSPATSVTGGRVTITGVSFVGYTTITKMTIGGISVLPSPAPLVDAGGGFSVDAAVPVLTKGLQLVNVTAGGVEKTVSLLVAVTAANPTATPAPTSTPAATPTPEFTATPAPTPTPTLIPLPPATATPVLPPTPAATPAPGPSVLLAPLGDNLVVVWSYDSGARSWEFFSPSPGFTGKNRLSTLVPDQLYWVRVKEDQSVQLNGRQRNVTAGWTLIHW